MNSYRLSLSGGQQAANRTSEPFYAVWNLESHPGTILESSPEYEYKIKLLHLLPVQQIMLIYNDLNTL